MRREVLGPAHRDLDEDAGRHRFDHRQVSALDGDERGLVVDGLAPLRDRLRSLDRGSLKIEAWTKNRGERGQITYVSIHAKDTTSWPHSRRSRTTSSDNSPTSTTGAPTGDPDPDAGSPIRWT